MTDDNSKSKPKPKVKETEADTPDQRVCVDKHEDLDAGNVKYIVEKALVDYDVLDIKIRQHRHLWGPTYTVKVYRECSPFQKVDGYLGLEYNH